MMIRCPRCKGSTFGISHEKAIISTRTGEPITDPYVLYVCAACNLVGKCRQLAGDVAEWQSTIHTEGSERITCIPFVAGVYSVP